MVQQTKIAIGDRVQLRKYGINARVQAKFDNNNWVLRRDKPLLTTFDGEFAIAIHEIVAESSKLDVVTHYDP